MTDTIDVEAAAKTFLAHTEEHLVSYLEACVHCGPMRRCLPFLRGVGRPETCAGL